jgi:hypothetical protein
MELGAQGFGAGQQQMSEYDGAERQQQRVPDLPEQENECEQPNSYQHRLQYAFEIGLVDGRHRLGTAAGRYMGIVAETAE